MGFGSSGIIFRMNQFYRPSVTGVPTTVTAVVVFDSAFEVISDAGVKGAVLTCDYVDVPRHTGEEDRFRLFAVFRGRES